MQTDDNFMSIGEKVAKFVYEVGIHTEIPEDVLAAAEVHVVDTVGAALAGSVVDAGLRLGQGLQMIFGGASAGLCDIWGTGASGSPALAALMNGTAAHSEDFDDTHTRAIVHGSACVVPAAWAAAQERGCSGEQMLAAIAVGWEVAARVGLAAHGEFHVRGWHTTSVAGTFGAAMAAARLFDLTAIEIVNALGICGSLAGGLNAYLDDGTRVKALHTGIAAEAGLIAAAAAAGGMTGPRRVFEGPSGLFEVFAGGCGNLDLLTEGLGESWEISAASLKPYPACHFAHAAIEAANAIRQQINVDEISGLWIRVPKGTFPLICEPWEVKKQTYGGYAAKFSLPFLVSSALVDGTVDRSTFSPEKAKRPIVARLMEMAQVSPLTDSGFPEVYDGEVRVVYEGKELRERVDVNRGHPLRPLSKDEIEEKFISNAVLRMSEPSARELLGRLESLRGASSLPTLGLLQHDLNDAGRKY